MTPSLMLYGVTLGSLLVGAAHFLDLGLRSLRWPARWVWAAALAGATFLPLALVLFPGRPGMVAPSRAVIPLEALYGLWGGAELPPAQKGTLLQHPGDLLLLAWVAASLLMALLFLGTILRLHRKSRRWARSRAGEEDILISDGLGPAVLGFLNPRIVLPPWALSLRAEELDVVLLHEAEHRRARDPALLAGGILTVALAPWNPALWWGLRRLRLAVEADCDGRVLGRGVSRKRYGRLLLGVASSADGFFPLAPALVEGGSTFLERRLRMMRNQVGRRRVGGAAAAALAGAFLLAVACETPTPPQDNPDSLREAETPEALDPAGTQEAARPLVEAADPGGTQTGPKVLLRKIEEDGTVSTEADGTEVFHGENQAPTKGVKLRIAEPPAGAKAVFEAGPLVIVDGVIMEDAVAKGVLADVDPDLVKSIEVIKGAAAEALYGERAAEGVILITMKK